MRLPELNVQKLKVAEMSGEKKGIPISVAPSTGQARGGGRPCAGAFPREEFNQTGTQRAWESPLAPLLGDVWVYGLLHAAGSIAVDLATGPL